MKKPPAPQKLNLEKAKLWQQANEIAEQMYGLLQEFPEEEKWLSANKLRGGANDLLWFVAQALSSAAPGGIEYEWGQARRNAGALKTIYRFSTRQKFIEIEPELMVKLNELISNIDEEVQKAYLRTQENNERELDRYRERVLLWEKSNREPKESA